MSGYYWSSDEDGSVSGFAWYRESVGAVILYNLLR